MNIKNNAIIVLFLLLLLIFYSCVSIKESNANKREIIIRYSKNFINKKYKYGVQDPYYGFDCSAFTQYVYKQADINIPRTALEQYKKSKKIDKNELEPGDLVFFIIDSNAISHVGIFLGNNNFIHSPSSGKNIRVDSLDNPYWKKVYAGSGTYLK